MAGVLEQARLLGLAATPITQRDRWVASPWLVALAEQPEELAATLAEHLPEGLVATSVVPPISGSWRATSAPSRVGTRSTSTASASASRRATTSGSPASSRPSPIAAPS